MWDTILTKINSFEISYASYYIEYNMDGISSRSGIGYDLKNSIYHCLTFDYINSCGYVKIKYSLYKKYLAFTPDFGFLETEDIIFSNM